jgi:hypothetical protein
MRAVLMAVEICVILAAAAPSSEAGRRSFAESPEPRPSGLGLCPNHSVNAQAIRGLKQQLCGQLLAHLLRRTQS